MTRPRPWLAAAFAVLPGLGHVYLREWTRAVLWFLTVLLAATLVLPEAAFETASLTDPVALLEAYDAAVAELSPLGLSVLALAVACNVLDAYSAGRRLATQRARDDGELPAQCPHCGRELDEDLDFCHWCTARLDDAAQPDDAPEI